MPMEKPSNLNDASSLKKTRKPKGVTPDAKTLRHRERARRSSLKKQQTEADIGPPPPIKNPRRRTKCRDSLLSYLRTYHGGHFGLPFSDVHLKLIADIQKVAIDGGQHFIVLPRGSGKSTILLFAVLWVMLYGHRRFPFLAPGDGEEAPEMINALKNDLITNELLLEDFPEVCYPFMRTDGIANRANYQVSRGESTGVKFGQFIRFPSMPENVARKNSGILVKAKGFLGAVRGKNVHYQGQTFRPDFYLIDDPQTLKSAYSAIETQKRRKIIKADLLRGAGPNTRPAVLGAATIIRRNDLAHQMCDPVQYPGWRVTRVAFLQTWPTAVDLWAKYKELRLRDLAVGMDADEANAMYVANREAMDAGGATYWPERIDPGTISSIQSAMNRWIDDPETFASEDQNDPLDEDAKNSDISVMVTEEDVNACVSSLPRGLLPIDAHSVYAFIDVSAKVLWWGVCAVSDKFSIHVVDYGTWPDNGAYTTLQTVTTNLRSHYGKSLDESLVAGIQEVMSRLSVRNYETPGGVVLPLKGGFVDSKWGLKNRLVRLTVWKSDYASLWLPYEGMGLGASARALNDVKSSPEPREVRGPQWRIMPEKEGLRIMADSNHWKSFAAQRIKDRCLTVFAGDSFSHRMLREQWTAEYPIRVESKTRKVDEWKKRPGSNDEHFWDVLYGCCVCASSHGVTMEGQEPIQQKRQRRRMSYDEMLAMGGANK